MTETVIDLDGLAEARNEAEARVSRLRQARGAAIITGVPIDAAEIAQAEAELQALDDAEGILTARQRDAIAGAEAARRGRIVAELKRLEGERLAAFGRAEAAARDLVKGINDALAVMAAMRLGISEIGATLPLCIHQHDARQRVGQRLAAILDGVTREGGGGLPLGPSVTLRNAAYRSASTDWAAAESVLMGDALETLKGS